MSNLLLKFRVKDSPYGVTRATLKAIAEKMDMSETMVIHLALSKLAKDVLPAYEIDEGPLSKSDLARIRRMAQPKIANKGKLLRSRSLPFPSSPS
jgi:hypothetical protein